MDSFAHRLAVNENLDHHDLGFLYTPSCVAAWRLTQRYQPTGRFLQAWGRVGDPKEYRLIIDCLLNLPLLWWAAAETGDSRYADIARAHTETAAATLFRADGSTSHTCFMDPVTGNPDHVMTSQGYKADSAWARGQAWGVLVMAGVWAAATAPLRRAAPAQVLEAPSAPGPEHTAARPKASGLGVLLGAGLLGLAVPVILHGALKDGVTSWVPTMVQANFGVSPALSAAVSMVLPLVNLTGAYLAGWLDRRWLHNELKTCAVLFGAATVALALLPLAVGRSLPLALALLAVTTAAMLGINTLFINVIPVRAGRSDGAAALSGLLNAVTYVGAAAATWGVGAAADSWGWSAVFILWLAMAVVSLVTVLLCAGRWARFTAEQEEV